MTQTSAQTPAKKVTPEGKKRTRKEAPALDLTSLTVVKAEAPKRQTTGIDISKNPFVKPIQESWAARQQFAKRPDGKGGYITTYLGEGRQVVVPTVNTAQVVALIRQAATHAEVGCAVQTTDQPGGKTLVKFAAKSRKQARKNGE